MKIKYKNKGQKPTDWMSKEKRKANRWRELNNYTIRMCINGFDVSSRRCYVNHIEP